MSQSDLHLADLLYYDFTPSIPPLDHLSCLVSIADRAGREAAAIGGRGRWHGTAYLVTARGSIM